MDMLFTILIALATLGILIAIHEFGHFWVARRCGVKVLKFSIGFGPSLIKYRAKDGVLYSLSAIPLGGYVKMAGEVAGEEPDGEEHELFNRKSVAARFAIVAAGPLINLLLAVVVFFALSLRGEVGLAPVVGDFRYDPALANVELERGQEIIKVDGELTPTWREVQMALLDRVGDTGVIELEVRYPQSSIVYDAEIQIEEFLSEGEISDPLEAIGLTPWSPVLKVVLAQVVEGGAADLAGLEVGDEIVDIDGIEFETVSAWIDYIQANAGQSLSAKIIRGDSEFYTELTPTAEVIDGVSIGKIGIGIAPLYYPEEMIREFHYSLPEAVVLGFTRTADTSIFVFESVLKMIRGDISVKNLSGPITIAKVASDSAQSGFASWLGLLALLSISLGVLNLLPIPVLDGGHLLFYIVEAVKGSPVSEQIQLIGLRVGMVLLLGVTFLAIYNDILRLN